MARIWHFREFFYFYPTLHHYKININNINNNINNININNTRGHKDKLYKPVVKTNLKLNSFSNRIINEWNKLPEEVIKSSDLNQFKRTFDKHYGDSKFIFNY